MKGNLFRELSPDCVIEDLEAMAKSMVGKPVTTAGLEIGEITSAVVVGDHIEWEAKERYTKEGKENVR